jgi:hypothetical protein
MTDYAEVIPGNLIEPFLPDFRQTIRKARWSKQRAVCAGSLRIREGRLRLQSKES